MVFIYSFFSPCVFNVTAITYLIDKNIFTSCDLYTKFDRVKQNIVRYLIVWSGVWDGSQLYTNNPFIFSRVTTK